VARLAVLANTNPPTDYGSQKMTGITPGADSVQWDYIQRNTLVTRGVSTTEVKDNVVNMSDTVTFYHPDGDVTPAYRFIVDIIKLQNILFNLDLIFMREDWNGAPLIPDIQPTTNELAKKPRMAVAEVNALIDNLGLAAIISDPETAKKTTVAQISASNPKRLDVSTTLQISGNSNIISVDFNWGFFFGTQTVIA
jgi:phage tail sheath gpL-like